MFPKFIKIVLAIASIGYAVYQFIEGNIGNGIAMIFLAGIFVFLYYVYDNSYLFTHIVLIMTIHQNYYCYHHHHHHHYCYYYYFVNISY